MKIYEFKKGDEIVRVEPAKPYSTERIGLFGQKEGGVRDRSYIGEKLIFVGIANGLIYCKRTDSYALKVFGDDLLEIPLDFFDEGWEFYTDPSKLLGGFEDSKMIKKQIETAIKNEDYELAKKLKAKLNNKK